MCLGERIEFNELCPCYGGAENAEPDLAGKRRAKILAGKIACARIRGRQRRQGETAKLEIGGALVVAPTKVL